LGPTDAKFAVAPHRNASSEVGEVHRDGDPFDGIPDGAR
jgi:hypothetical protein